MDEPAPTPTSQVRRTDVLFLPRLGAGIREHFEQNGLEQKDWRDICSASLTASCTICDETLQGDEWAEWLLTVGTDEHVPREGLRWVRLKQGLCANDKCNVRFYQIHFHPHPNVDWSAVPIGALGGKETPRPTSVVELAGDTVKESVARQFTTRTVVTLVVLVLLWMFHQWYRGGEIPVIRPAKDYTSEVDPDSDSLKVEPPDR